MVDFDPSFEIMPGTKTRTPEVTGYVESGIVGKADPYEAVPRQTIAEWPFVAIAASSHCKLGHVRFGSLADITARSRHVRFTPDSGHSSVQVGCPKSARSGHSVI